jgi:hypothetical protein
VDSAKIEVIGGLGVMDYSPREVIELHGTPGYVAIQGWAIDAMRSEPAGRVYVELDGKTYPARYGMPHAAVAAALGRQYATAGFQWVAPEWMLGGAVHELRLRFLSRDGLRWCASRQRFRFRVNSR